MTITAVPRQTIFDLALQATGSLEGLGAIIQTNEFGEGELESDDLGGRSVSFENGDVVNEVVRSSFTARPPVTK